MSEEQRMDLENDIRNIFNRHSTEEAERIKKLKEEVHRLLDDNWDERKDWFGNDGIDCCTARVMPASLSAESRL